MNYDCIDCLDSFLGAALVCDVDSLVACLLACVHTYVLDVCRSTAL